jgi:hypothetical protein
MQTQANKYKFLRELQEKYNVPILVAGDIFNHHKPSPYLLSWALRNLPDNIIAICGQHDLPNHNLGNIEKSGIQVLAEAGKIRVLNTTRPFHDKSFNFSITGFSWGTTKAGARNVCSVPQVALLHHLVYQGKPPFPGAETCGGTAKVILKSMPGFRLVLCGDNHQSFVEHCGDSVLVNPGSLMRTTSAQRDFKPSVYLWDAETNEVERVFVPIEEGVVSREHLEVKEERDERIEAFVSKLSDDITIGISYEDNMKQYLAENRVGTAVETIIWEVMGL